MKYIVDTQAVLWFLSGNDQLSTTARQLIENEQNELLVSMASIWEITIKTQLGKLVINGSYETLEYDLLRNNMGTLSILFAHTVEQQKLTLLHRDPFDRMIVSQAMVESIDLISSDSIFDEYLINRSIKRIW